MFFHFHLNKHNGFFRFLVNHNVDNSNNPLYYIHKQRKRVKQIVLLSLFIGGVSTLLIFMFPKFFLNLIYHTDLGANYIKTLAPFLLLYFINTPISNALQAINKSKEALFSTTISSVRKLITLSVFSLMKIGMQGLIISIIVSILTSTYLNIKSLKSAF